MELDLNVWKAPFFYQGNPAVYNEFTTFNIDDYTDLEFDIYGLSGANGLLPQIFLELTPNTWSIIGNQLTAAGAGGYVPISSSWQHVKIPLTAFGVNPGTRICGFRIHYRIPSAGNYGHILLDNVRFVKYLDIMPPTLAAAKNTDLSHISITFSEKVNAQDAGTTSNYMITSPTDPNFTPGIAPNGLQLSSNGDEAVLALDQPLRQGDTYVVKVGNIHDLSQVPNIINPDSEISFAATLVLVDVNIDANANNHAISPLIYGVSTSGGSQPYYKDMGITLVRWGGNARTRHNWEINASNSGSDWEFRNRNQAGGSTVAGKASLDFVNSNKSVGAESLLAIPTIGWVAKDGSDSTLSAGVPNEGGSAATPGSDTARFCDGTTYDPTANRNATSIPSFARKGAPFSLNPDKADGKVYQDEWVNYLKNTVGDAQGTDANDPAKHGVKFYAMDNEPDLWADATHVDVHPVRFSYDEALSTFIEYGEAAKAVDPTAKVTAPVGWGWLSLWYSALDSGCDSYGTHADRRAHGDMPFYQWFLQKAKEHDDRVGYRTLDVLDTHYYPQGGVYWPGGTDPALQAKRLRSTRSLWDPNYADESWMADTEGGPNLRLIPRLKEWINQYYPGTKLGLTEWDWGASDHINGVLTVADILGIFGREDVYLATFWGVPPAPDPALTTSTTSYWAWRVYRNYDGNFSKFGDISIKADAPIAEVDNISVYASKASDTNELKIILVNKNSAEYLNPRINIANFSVGNTAKVYQYSQADLSRIRQLSDLSSLNNNITCTLPPYSITLLVIGSSSQALTGDINSDTQVNVLDIQACVNDILGIQEQGGRADVNNDGSVNVLDVQAIVNISLGA